MADLRLTRRQRAALAAIGAGAVAACGPAGAASTGAGATATATATAAPAMAATAQAAGISVPPGWQVLPPLAFTAKTALGSAAAIEAVEAWGEPAMGCYAVWIAVRAAGGAETVGAQIAAGFAGEVERSKAMAAGAAGSGGSAATSRSGGSGGSAGAAAGAGAGAKAAPAKLVVKDVVTPRGEAGLVTLAFEQGEHRGRLRARVDGERIAALACFANQREPIACESACNGVLGAIK